MTHKKLHTTRIGHHKTTNVKGSKFLNGVIHGSVFRDGVIDGTVSTDRTGMFGRQGFLDRDKGTRSRSESGPKGNGSTENGRGGSAKHGGDGEGKDVVVV